MASKGRPPIAAAKQYAVGKLIEKYEGEFKDFSDEYLAQQGWARKDVTVSKWTQEAK
jgi:hypothetical protein